MMFTMSHKDDKNNNNSNNNNKSIRKSIIKKQTVPTEADIQKKFDEQSFKHQMLEQWSEVQKKAIFVPPVIVKSVISGEPPHMVTKEEEFNVSIAQRIFLLFDQPEHCFLGEIISFVTMIVILISCVGYIAATGAKYQPSTCQDPACHNDPNLCPNTMICPPEESPVFELVETVCIAFFTMDYFIRLFLVPLMPARLAGILPSYFDFLNSNGIMPAPQYSVPTTIWRYMTMPMNIIDLVAILPFYVAYFSTSGSSVSIIRILRLVRVLRVFKIGGMGNGVTLMSNAMMNSLSAMGILLFFTVLGVILFGSIIFFLESGNFVVNEDYPDGAFLRWDVLHSDKEESPFSSILVSCYWAMVTFTTVGYGDLVPTSPFGRFVSLVLMYTGILVLALPISVIGANFQREYERLNNSDIFEDDDIPCSVGDASRDDGGEHSPPRKSSAPPKRGVLRSLSSTGSVGASRDRRPSLEIQVERLVKKTLHRERSNSMSSVVPDDIHEAIIPVHDQLKILTSVCGQMMDRIEELQRQQNVLFNRSQFNDSEDNVAETVCDSFTAKENGNCFEVKEDVVGIQLSAIKAALNIPADDYIGDIVDDSQ